MTGSQNMIRMQTALLTKLALFFVLLSQNAFAFDTSGYLRTGYGVSEGGTDQACFKAPGAMAKHRLGNECENYFELGMLHSFPAKDKNALSFKTKVLFAFQSSGHRDWESTNPDVSIDANNDVSSSADATIAFREAFAAASYDFDTEKVFWAGKRFYRRRDIHMLDYYLLINTGQGAGVENIAIGLHKLSVALLRNLPKTEGSAQNNLDLRFSNIPIPHLGIMEMALIYGYTTGKDAYTGQGSWKQMDGFNLSFLFDRSFKSSHNLLALQAGTGLFGGIGAWGTTGLDQFGAWGSQNIASDDGDAASSRKKSTTLRIVDQYVAEWSKDFSTSFVAFLQDVDFGGYNQLGSGFGKDRPNLTETTLGVRPIWRVTDQYDLALEYGVTSVQNAFKSETQDKYFDSELQKLTLAGMISNGDFYWARPQLRLFVTHAQWNENSKGKISGAEVPYGADTSGWSFGAQAEVWW